MTTWLKRESLNLAKQTARNRHQIAREKLRILERASGGESEASVSESDRLFEAGLERLTNDELDMYAWLLNKMRGVDDTPMPKIGCKRCESASSRPKAS